MSNKKFVNKGLQIGTQINQSGANVNNAARDIIINKNATGASLQEFQALLGQINSQVRATSLSASDKQDIEAILKQVLKQSQIDKPRKDLIVTPLKTAFDLLVQAGGAAKAVETIVPLLNKAMAFAQNLF